MWMYKKKLSLSVLALCVLSACGGGEGGAQSTTAMQVDAAQTAATTAGDASSSASFELAVDPHQEVPADGVKTALSVASTPVLTTTASTATVGAVKGPQVAIVSPLPEEHFDFPAKVHVAAQVKSLDSKITKVEFYNGSTLLGTSRSAFTAFTLPWPKGRYVVQVVAYDEQGRSQSSSVPIHVGVYDPLARPGWTLLAAQDRPYGIDAQNPRGEYVRFGQGLNWTYKYLNGPGRCDVQTFGVDPAPGKAKVCEHQDARYAEWTQNVAQGQALDFKGYPTAGFRFGNSRGFWVQKLVEANQPSTCAAQFFGADPAPGEFKWCEMYVGPVLHWAVVATDGQSFKSEGMTVRYGTTLADEREASNALDVYSEIYIPAGVTASCTKAFFGGDPAPDAKKACRKLVRVPRLP